MYWLLICGTMFELTQIMRQQDCLPFAELLSRLREGNHTSEDIQTLQTRLISADAPDYPNSVQHLFKTNAQVDKFNRLVYESCTFHKVVVTSVDSVIGSVSDDTTRHILNLIPEDTRKTMQLAANIPLAVGCRYEISMNINISDGLANGASGVLEKIQLTSDDHSASGIIWIKFDDAHVGSQTRIESRALYKADISPTWTPISPVCRQFQVGKSHINQVMRKQFPVRQSAAKTIHRCQGDTLNEVAVDFTSSRKDAHSHYVGLSRVKTLDGLFILNLCSDKIQVSENVKTEMLQLRSERSMNISIYRPYLHSHSDYQIVFLNARSLHKHISCIRKDHFLLACDLLLFCETRVSPTDNDDFYQIDDFNHVQFPDVSREQRSYYGLALYSKLPIVFSQQSLTLADDSSHGTVEAFLTVVAIHSQLLLKIACVYIRPNSSVSHIRNSMSNLLRQLLQVECDQPGVQQHTIILGDFNMDWADSSVRNTMSDVFHGYSQLVQETSTDYDSILDHVYTTLPPDSVHCSTLESYFTDHKPIVLSLHIAHKMETE